MKGYQTLFSRMKMSFISLLEVMFRISVCYLGKRLQVSFVKSYSEMLAICHIPLNITLKSVMMILEIRIC